MSSSLLAASSEALLLSNKLTNWGSTCSTVPWNQGSTKFCFLTNLSLGSMVPWNPTCVNQTSINKISGVSVVPFNTKIDTECATA